MVYGAFIGVFACSVGSVNKCFIIGVEVVLWLELDLAFDTIFHSNFK